MAFIVPLLIVASFGETAAAAEPLQVRVAGCRPKIVGSFTSGYSGPGYGNSGSGTQEVEMLIAFHLGANGDDVGDAIDLVDSIEVCIVNGNPESPTVNCPGGSDFTVYSSDGSGQFSSIENGWVETSVGGTFFDNPPASSIAAGLAASREAIASFPFNWRNDSTVGFILKVDYADDSLNLEGEEALLQQGGCAGFDFPTPDASDEIIVLTPSLYEPWGVNLCTDGSHAFWRGRPEQFPNNLCMSDGVTTLAAQLFEGMDRSFDSIQSGVSLVHVWRNGEVSGGGYNPRQIFITPNPGLGQAGESAVYMNPLSGIEDFNEGASTFRGRWTSNGLSLAGHEYFHAFQGVWSRERGDAWWIGQGFTESHAQAGRYSICVSDLPEATDMDAECFNSAKFGASESMGTGDPDDFSHPQNAHWRNPYEGHPVWSYIAQQFSYPVGTEPHPTGTETALPRDEGPENERRTDEGFDIMGYLYDGWSNKTSGDTKDSIVSQVLTAHLGRSMRSVIDDYQTAKFLKEYVETNPRWKYDWTIRSGADEPTSLSELKPLSIPSDPNGQPYGDKDGTRYYDAYGRATRDLDSRTSGTAFDLMPVETNRGITTPKKVAPFGAFAASVAPDPAWEGSTMRVQAEVLAGADIRYRVFRIQRNGDGDPVPEVVCGDPTPCAFHADTTAGISYIDEMVDIDADTEEVLLIGSAGSLGGFFTYQFGDPNISVEVVYPKSSRRADIGHPDSGRRSFLMSVIIRDEDGRHVALADEDTLDDFQVEVDGCAASDCILPASALDIFPVVGSQAIVAVTIPSDFYPDEDSGTLGLTVTYLDASDTRANALNFNVDVPTQASVLALDKSGSMLEYDGVKLVAMKTVAASLVHSMVPPDGPADDSQVGIVLFDNDATTLQSLVGLDQDMARDIEEMIGDIPEDGGGTSIGDALFESQSILSTFDEDPDAPDLQSVILVSDGINESDSTVEEYLNENSSPPTSDGDGGAWASTTLNYFARDEEGLPLPSFGAIGIGQNADLTALDLITQKSGNAPLLVIAPVEDTSFSSLDGIPSRRQLTMDLADSFGFSFTEAQGRARSHSVGLTGPGVIQVPKQSGPGTVPDSTSFFVEDGARELRVLITADGQATGALKSPPSGTVVPPTSVSSDLSSRSYRIVDPPSGFWQFEASGFTQSSPNIFVDVAIDSTFIFKAFARPEGGSDDDPDVALVGTPVVIKAIPYDLGKVPGCSMSTRVTRPSGAFEFVSMRDDGNNGDAVAGDGAYSRRITATGEAGHYTVKIDAGCVLPGTGQHVSREARVDFVVRQPTAQEDQDGDGIPDIHEVLCLDPNTNDSQLDFDGDGLSNADELIWGTSPCTGDTDGGGESDWSEVFSNEDPLDPSDDEVNTPPLSATAGNASAVLELGAYLGQYITNVQRGPSAQGPWTFITADWNSSYMWKDTGLTNGEQVCYRARMISVTAATGAWSPAVCVTPMADPNPPRIVTDNDHGACGRDYFVPVLDIDSHDESTVGDIDLGTIETPIVEYRFWLDDDAPSGDEEGWLPFDGVPLLPAPEGAEYVHFELRDEAGNVGTSDILLACTLPTCQSEPLSVACCTDVANCPGLADFAFYSSNSLKLGGRTIPQNEAGEYSSVANAGSGLFELGAEAEIGDVWAFGNAFLGDRSTVQGDITVGGTISEQNQVEIIGQETQGFAGLEFPQLSEFTIDFGADATQGVHLEPGQIQSLLPGRQGAVHLKSNTELQLTPGVYLFDSLTLEPSSKITYSTAAGPVYVYVRDAFTHRGRFVDATGNKNLLFIGYFGTTTGWVEGPLAGTLVAPQARIDVKNLNGLTHHGAVFAKDIELHAQTLFVHVPFAAPWEGSAVAGASWLQPKRENLEGCGCSMPGRSGSTPWLPLALFLPILFVGRRVRRRFNQAA